MSTIKDVAKLAGVSVATVSNYINKTKVVSERRASDIADAIETLNYIPNQMAKNLKANINKTIAVILPNLQDNYYLQIFQSIQDYFSDKSYSVNISVTNDNKELEIKYTEEYLQRKICGFIIVSCQPQNTNFFRRKFVQKQVPFVCLDRYIDIEDVSFFGFNNKDTIYKITDEFIKEGKKKICILTGSGKYSCEQDAIKGYKEALKDNSITVNEEYIISSYMTKEAGFKNCMVCLKDNSPDAIITTSKVVTSGVIEALSASGLIPGKDIYVATLGEDNWDKLNHFQNVITTSREAFVLGREAANELYEKIESDLQNSGKINLYDDKYIIQKQNTHIYTGKKAEIKAVMLDSTQVNTFEYLLPIFKNKFNIDVRVKKITQDKMFEYVYDEHLREDIIMYDIHWRHVLSEQNILLNITDMLKQPGFDSSVYLDDSINDYGQVNGQIYGFPFIIAPQILFYRKDIFENKLLKNDFEKKYNIKFRPPRVWQEFNKVAEFLTQSINPVSPVKYGTVIAGKYVEHLIPELYLRLNAYGSEIYDKNLNITFNSKKTFKAMNDFINLIKNTSPDYMVYNDMLAIDEFLKGNVAMLISYPSLITDITNFQTSYMAGNIGFTYPPSKSSTLGGWGLGINSRSSHKEEAFEFIKWVNSEEISNYCTIMAGQSAVKSTMENNELLTLYPWISIYKEVYKYSRHENSPKLKNGSYVPRAYIDDILCDVVYDTINHGIPLESALLKAEKKLYEIIN